MQDPAVLNARREAVKEAMLEMAMVRWSVPETVQYALHNASTIFPGGEMCKQCLAFLRLFPYNKLIYYFYHKR